MKKILLLLAVFAFVGTTAQAQCTKSKTAAHTSKKACAAKSSAVKVADAGAKTCTKAADAAMVGNMSIVKKVSDQGDVSYARKKTCAASGKVSYEDVKYCSKSQAFVNVAPADAATAVTVATAEKKVCSKAVATALAANPDVEKRTCAASGKVSYMKKKTCAASGKVSYEDVKYCADSKAFVNMAPAKKAACSKSASAKGVSLNADGAKKSCTAAEKAACAKSKGASAKGVSMSADGAKKSCAKTCAKSGKTCTKGKKAAVKAQAVQSDVKVIKTSNQ